MAEVQEVVETQNDGETPVEEKPKVEIAPSTNISEIGNREVRHKHYTKLKREKKKDKKKRRETRKKIAEAMGENAPAKLVPKTIESMRERDETTVKVDADEQDEEVQWDIENDDFKEYFAKSYEPKVLITTGDNPHTKTLAFVKELTRIIPNSTPLWRKSASIKKMVKSSIENKYTDIMIINEDNRVPNGLVVTHLPDGPTAHFKLSNVKITKDIKKSWREITEHRPEVVLNNFTTRLGHSVARMLAALFHYEPQFRGQRVVTFHNQRDYIFFRHHKYDFKSEEKVKLREQGPRFTLRLRSLQKGTFDSKTGEYEWVKAGRRHELEQSRRRFYL